VNNGGRHEPRDAQGKIYLREGLHNIKIRYVQFGGDAILGISYAHAQGLRLTKQSLQRLREEGLPENIVERLKPLKWQKFAREHEFLEAVGHHLDNKQMVTYQQQIVKHAGGRTPLSSEILLPSYPDMLRVRLSRIDKRVLLVALIIFLIALGEHMLFGKKPTSAKSVWVEIVIVVMLFSLAFGVGTRYVSAFTHSGYVPRFYQKYFGPAVMLACGRGFVNPDNSQLPVLDDFLYLRSDSFACGELPADLTIYNLNPVQLFSRYLMYIIAFMWVVSGVSWSSLLPLYGIWFGLTIVLYYGIFRLGMRRSLSIIATLALMMSHLHLRNLPHLRDYAKAPFILAMILIMGCLVAFPTKRSTLLGLSVAAGIVLGVGIGFRTDLFITTVPFALTICLFLPNSLRANVKLKIEAFALFAGCFILIGLPILAFYGKARGFGFGHWILQGLMFPSNAILGIQGSLYHWGYSSLDSFITTVTNSYAARMLGSSTVYYVHSEGYSPISSRYVFEIAKNFPADMLIRWYATLLKIVELPFNPTPGSDYVLKMGADNLFSSLIKLYSWRTQMLRMFAGIGVYTVGGALMISVARGWRKGFFLLGCLLYFGGYPVLRFSGRHVFYLEFMTWWAAGFIMQQLTHVVSMMLRSKQRGVIRKFVTQPRYWRVPAQRIIWLTLGVVLVVAAPLLALRAYQQAHVRSLLHSYANAEREPLHVSQTLLEQDRILLESQQLNVLPQPTETVHTDYLVVEFASESLCHISQIQSIFRYAFTDPLVDFSQEMQIHLASQNETPTWLFFPVFSGSYGDPVFNGTYDTHEYHFQGIELSQRDKACFRGLYRIKNVSQLPLLIYFTSFPSWEQTALYQKLGE
jgi:hypothetical protein